MVKRDMIVIGASAGGIKALTQLLQNLPVKLAASLLVVIHRPAEKLSLLSEVLQNNTRLIVATPTDGQIIRYNHLYLAPQNYHMITKDGRIHLTQEPRVNYHRPAIDPLFRSAAIHYGPRVIGVILSGELDDGTVGLGLVKNYNGLTIVQDPGSAEHPDMPRSALENVKIDHCLAPPEIAQLIEVLVKSPIKSKRKSFSQTLLLETQLATKTSLRPSQLNRLGKITAFTCPECHGSLWEIDSNHLLRYRCRIGHSYNPDTLLVAHDDTTENILWAAIRTLEENAELSERVMRKTEKYHSLTRNFFREKAKESRKNAEKLKEILFNNKKTNYFPKESLHEKPDVP